LIAVLSSPTTLSSDQRLPEHFQLALGRLQQAQPRTNNLTSRAVTAAIYLTRNEFFKVVTQAHTRVSGHGTPPEVPDIGTPGRACQSAPNQSARDFPSTQNRGRVAISR